MEARLNNDLKLTFNIIFGIITELDILDIGRFEDHAESGRLSISVEAEIYKYSFEKK